MIRKVLLLVFGVIMLMLIWYFPLVSYGVKQGIGQLNIVWSARSIEEVKNDPTVPDSIKYGLSLVREVVTFGVTNIGLKDKGNYNSYYDQKGNPVLYLVTASEPYALVPYEWKFPIVGLVPYKGFFNKKDAEKEQQKLLDAGYDVSIRIPGGWSTLGWFNDPVLSNMLARSKGDLANVILHEMTHATVFVKDSIDYNENLASFIGDEATLLFLKKKFGEGSEEWSNYLQEEEDFIRYTRHILNGADKLDSIYSSLENKSNDEKIVIKTKMIKEIVNSTDTIAFHNPERFIWKSEVLPNNAYFLSFLRYRAQQNDFKTILKKDFNNDLKAFVTYLKEKYN